MGLEHPLSVPQSDRDSDSIHADVMEISSTNPTAFKLGQWRAQLYCEARGNIVGTCHDLFPFPPEKRGGF